MIETCCKAWLTVAFKQTGEIQNRWHLNKEFAILNENSSISFKKSRSSKRWYLGRGQNKNKKKLHVMTRTYARKDVHTVQTQRHSTMTRYCLELGPKLGQVFVCFFFPLSSILVRKFWRPVRTRYFVTRRSTLQDYKRRNGRWPGDDDETSGHSKVLLALLFLIDGILNGLAFGLVASAQIINLALHLRVQVGHSLLKFFETQELELQSSTHCYCFLF